MQYKACHCSAVPNAVHNPSCDHPCLIHVWACSLRSSIHTAQARGYTGSPFCCLMAQTLLFLPSTDLLLGLLQAPGAKDLAQGLVNNVSLHNLNLAWNGLEDAGCTAIAYTLHQNMGLKVRLCRTRSEMGGQPLSEMGGTWKDITRLQAAQYPTPLTKSQCWRLQRCDSVMATVMVSCPFGLSAPNKGHS